MIRNFFVALVLVFSTVYSTAAFAEGAQDAIFDAKGWVGGLFGLQVPTYDDVDSRTAWGLTAGAKMGSEIGLGAYYISAPGEASLGGAGAKFNYSLIGIELTYQFEGEASGMYLGGRLGLTNLETQVAGITNDFNPYHWGALVGYNHYLARTISIGGEGTFFSVPKDSDSSGTAATSKAFEIIALMASLKFWF
jgi:hypothetical protein